eukprot:13089-Amorphochlora_amoeboformis.AAC.1
MDTLGMLKKASQDQREPKPTLVVTSARGWSGDEALPQPPLGLMNCLRGIDIADLLRPGLVREDSASCC